MDDVYSRKAAVPRSAKTASTLREALARWGTDRLLNVVDASEGCDNPYRREFGQIHRRYANMTFLISEAIANNNLEYTARTLLHWIEEDFGNALTGAQKDAAGLCAAELSNIIDLFEEK
jgi:hypothetical protein